MAGVYFHIPFCSKACHYCNFHFSTSLHRKAGLLQSMAKELEVFAAKQEYKRPASTLYFGGGTPSILTASELNKLLAAAGKAFIWSGDAEITMEVNPGDCTLQNLQNWKQAGINRLSIGVQSFYQPHLEWMNRSHNAAQSVDSVFQASKAGFNNISIDLIFGLPGQSTLQWNEQLEKAFSLPIKHISAYALTVEEGTALYYFIQKKKVAAPLEDLQADQFLLLQQKMQQKGWDAYEISNYCKPGFKSRHNTAYWTGVPYFGFGPSAHSFDGINTRWWNVANNGLYIKALEAQQPFCEKEELSTVQLLNEKLMTGLRRREGILFDEKSTTISDIQVTPAQLKTFLLRASKYTDQGLAKIVDSSLILTVNGKLYADRLAADLFLEE